MKNYFGILSSWIGGASLLAIAEPLVSVTSPALSFDLVTYAVVVAISLLAGFLTAIPRYLADEHASHQALRLTYDLLGAVFVGLITFWVCQSFEWGLLRTVAAVAINALAGVGGVKGLRWLVNALRNGGQQKP